jgi:acetyltransferase-like isoleucine patch superfamily enzyme
LIGFCACPGGWQSALARAIDPENAGGHALEKGATIRRGARVGGGSLLLPAVEIGEEAFVAAGSIVTRDVPHHKLVMGSPAKVLRDVPEDELLENQ